MIRPSVSRPPHVVILGNSNIGQRIALEGINRGWRRVSVTTRTPNLSHPKIDYIHTPPHLIRDSNFWKDLADKHFSAPLLVINSNGCSIPDSGVSIRDVNVTLPVAALKGITEHVKTWRINHKYAVVQLSTIAADGLEAEYGTTKREAETLLKELPIEHLTIFRIGDVIAPKIADEVTDIIKKQHQLSMEELALLPLTFVIGDHPKQVILQSIFVDDIAKAAFNAFDLPAGVRTINAVNSDVMTQEELFKFFRDLYGRKFRPWYFPMEAAKKLVKHHPCGHFVPYAIEYCEKGGKILPHQEFEALVGAPLKTLAESYRLRDQQELAIPHPPIGAYALKVLRTLWEKPESRRDTFSGVKLLAKAFFQIKGEPLPVRAQTVKFRTMSEQDFNKNADLNRKFNGI